MTKGIHELKADVREVISVPLTVQQGDSDLSGQALLQSGFQGLLDQFYHNLWRTHFSYCFRDEGAETQDAGKLSGTYTQSLVFWNTLKVGRW